MSMSTLCLQKFPQIDFEYNFKTTTTKPQNHYPTLPTALVWGNQESLTWTSLVGLFCGVLLMPGSWSYSLCISGWEWVDVLASQNQGFPGGEEYAEVRRERQGKALWNWIGVCNLCIKYVCVRVSLLNMCCWKHTCPCDLNGPDSEAS